MIERQGDCLPHREPADNDVFGCAGSERGDRRSERMSAKPGAKHEALHRHSHSEESHPPFRTLTCVAVKWQDLEVCVFFRLNMSYLF